MNFASEIRTRVRQWTGIPVSIGLGPTKTLAKVANKLAKKGNGVVNLLHAGERDHALLAFDVADIWGVGRQTTDALARLGITTAAQLRDADPRRIRQRFTVTGERIVHELRGQACLDLEAPQPRKNIICSRMFGRSVTDLADIAEAVCSYAARAAEKLRAQHSRAQAVQVFIHTSRFRPGDRQHHPAMTAAFDHPTSDSFQIVKTAWHLLRQIHTPGHNYNKAGIMLLDIVPEDYQQAHFFAAGERERADGIMRTLDSINRRMGAGTLFLASQGIRKSWAMRRNLKSPYYTTRLSEIPSAG